MTTRRHTLRGQSLLRLVAIGLILLMFGALNSPVADANGSLSHVVVANRGSGDISVIDTTSLNVTTVDLPGEAEPMYVNHDPDDGVVFVGDRASSSVVVLDDHDYSVVDSIAVGEGVFHQWYDDGADQLWVVGDTSQTVTVIDSESLAVEATIEIPADLIERGGKPHDVFVKNRLAFVSILGLDDGTAGVVLQYSTRTFNERDRIDTGGDPHLFVRGFRLYVASQDASSVSLYRASSLAPLGEIDVPSAHGIYVTNRREVLVTNIGGGGVDALWELNRGLTGVVDKVDTEFAVPHNVTVDDSRQAWVTHSGMSDQVSVIKLRANGFGPVETVTVGANPFGLAHVQLAG